MYINKLNAINKEKEKRHKEEGSKAAADESIKAKRNSHDCYG